MGSNRNKVNTSKGRTSGRYCPTRKLHIRTTVYAHDHGDQHKQHMAKRHDTGGNVMSEQLLLLPDYGDLIPMRRWRESVKYGLFIPYDGSGCWATKTRYDATSNVWQDKRPKWATHVMWFNK